MSATENELLAEMTEGNTSASVDITTGYCQCVDGVSNSVFEKVEAKIQLDIIDYFEVALILSRQVRWHLWAWMAG